MLFMKPYRSVIVGCGPRAYWHARAYGLTNRGEVVACCDVDQERLNRFKDEFGIAGYSDAAVMIRQEKPDLVHLVTPPDTRVELMSLVSDCGVPACIVEKPVACEVKDWRQLCELEAVTGTRFAVGKQFRFHPHLSRCRQALSEGRLGKLLLLDFSAGMNISGQGTHIIDWAMSLNEDSPVVRVFGAASGVSMEDQQHPAPDTTMAQVVFANGVYGFWNNGFTARRVAGDEAVYKHCRVAAYAEQGRILYEEFGRWEIVTPGGIESGETTAAEWEENNHRAQAGLVDSVFDWMEDDSKPSGTSLKRALHQWNVVLGLYASALWRKPVNIPFDPPDDLFAELCASLRNRKVGDR